MEFEVKMRDGTSYDVEASYIEVIDGPTDSTYALLGPIPGYPIAILAAFPVEQVLTVLPRSHAQPARPGGLATDRVAAVVDPAEDDSDLGSDSMEGDASSEAGEGDSSSSRGAEEPPAQRPQLTEDIY